MKNLLIAILALCVLCISCNRNEDNIKAAISVSRNIVDIETAEGGTDTVKLYANKAWTVEIATAKSEEVDWITVEPMTGNATAEGGDVITLTVDSMAETISSRSAVVVFRIDEANYAEVTVSQSNQRTISAGELSKLIVDMKDLAPLSGVADYVEGIVAANNAGGNLMDGLSIVDGTGKPFSGFYLSEQECDEGYNIGDKVRIRLLNARVDVWSELRRDVAFNVYEEDVEVVSTDHQSTTPEVTVGQISEKDYQGMYVTVKAVSYTDDAEGATWVDAENEDSGERTFADAAGASFTVVTDAYAEWSATAADPEATGDISGVIKDGKIYPISTQDISAFLKKEIIEGEMTIADFKKLQDTTDFYELTAMLINIQSASVGQCIIEDYTGRLEVVYITEKQGDEIVIIEDEENKIENAYTTFKNIGLREGDVLTLVGRKNKAGDMTEAHYVSHIRPVVATVSEVLEASASNDVWYKVRGAITEISDATSGRLTISDGSKSILVGGLTAKKTDENDNTFGKIEGLKVTDTLTLIGTRTSDGIGGPAFYVSHKEYVEPPKPQNDTVAVTIKAFKEKKVDGVTWYELQGTLTDDAKSGAPGIDINDGTGTITVQKMSVSKDAEWDQTALDALALKQGDVVKVHAKRGTISGVVEAATPAYLVEIVERAPEETAPDPIDETLIDGKVAKREGEEEFAWVLSFNPKADDPSLYNVLFHIVPANKNSFEGTFYINGNPEADGVLKGGNYSRYYGTGFKAGTKLVVSSSGSTYTVTLEGYLDDKWGGTSIKLKYSGTLDVEVDVPGGDNSGGFVSF